MATQIHKCGRCHEDWPATPEFKACPGCGTPCAVVRTGDHTPNLEEARHRAKRAQFERYLREESQEDRARRQDDGFNDIIAGAGFQDWEIESIRSAEEVLRQRSSEKAA